MTRRSVSTTNTVRHGESGEVLGVYPTITQALRAQSGGVPYYVEQTDYTNDDQTVAEHIAEATGRDVADVLAELAAEPDESFVPDPNPPEPDPDPDLPAA